MVPIELLISLVLVGLAAGTASGLFGIGGGIISVPFVIFLTEASFREAVAMSLFAIALTVPMGLWSHSRAGSVHWVTGGALGLGGVAGIAAATFIDPWLNEFALMWLFAAFLVFAGHRVAYGTEPLLKDVSGPLALAVTGVAAGLVAKLLGIGGGVLMVPALFFYGFTIHHAVATSLVAVFTNGAISTGVNLVRIPGDWILLGLPLALGSWVGVLLGSRTAIRSQSLALRRAFAVLLLLVSLSLVVRSFERAA